MRGCQVWCLVFAALLVGRAADGAAVCAKCHPAETARFEASAMGRSIGKPEFIAPGRSTQETAGAVLSSGFVGGRMVHRLSERGVTAEYPVAYQIGNGTKARSYAVQIGDYLLESPLSWFKAAGWAPSPGYESMQLVDFDRPVTENCLFCHAGRFKAVDADGRAVASSPIPAISCERCHGDSESHVQHPSARNIVNPAKLAGAARDSVCEQCHLEGETRTLNPGKTLWDYRPGEALEQTAVTWLLRKPQQEQRAVNQVEELAQSQCARASGGKLWCGSCHDPHGAPSVGVAQVERACVSCHPALSKPAHLAATNGCVACHMPSRPANNIAHLAVTDHRIRRPGAADQVAHEGAPMLVAWREPPAQFRQRDLALANLQIGSEQKLPAMVSEGLRRIEALPEAQQQNDPDVLSSLEVAFLETAGPAKSLALGSWAVESVPRSATFAMNYGIALKRAGKTAEAERELLRAIGLDPSLMRAYAELAVLYDSGGKKAESRAVVERFLRWNPLSIQFRLGQP